MAASKTLKQNKLILRKAGRKGRGVFALKPIRRGEVIECGPALLLPKREVSSLLSSFLGHYIFQTDRGKGYVIGLGWASLFNHSDNANAEFYATQSFVTIKALQTIAVGAEITVDYGWTKREWADAGLTKE